MRKARDAPIHVIDVFAKDQMSSAQHVRHAMAGTSSQPKPVDLASISVSELLNVLIGEYSDSRWIP